MKAQPPVRQRRGFALIATISVLLLLTLIAVAFLSLSAVSVRTARIDFAEEEARSNARLALMIALGELQREMGPDQRVSAAGSILDTTPDSPDVTKSDVAQQHWVGVWSTNWAETSGGVTQGSSAPEDRTPWLRNDSAGGLIDRRFSRTWDREDSVQSWLVSGNEGGRIRVRKAGREFFEPKNGEKDFKDDMITLAGPGSVVRDEDTVIVKAVSLQREVRGPTGVVSDKPMGRYGYWVTSNNAKANLGVVNKHTDKVPSPSAQIGYEGIFNSQSVESSAITGIGKISPLDAQRIVSPATLRLATNADENEMKEIFHDVTTQSRSLLVNARDGGLQKDLSVFIADGINSAQGIPDLDPQRLEYLGLESDDNLVGPANDRVASLTGVSNPRFEESSPKFGIIESWLETGRRQNFTLTQDKVDLSSKQELLPQLTEYEKDPKWDVYDRLLSKPSAGKNQAPAHTNLSSISMKPVVVEASIYYNLAKRQAGQFNGQRRWIDYVCLYPRVALWNPYNVAMTLPPMICQMFVNGNKEVMVTYADGRNERLYLGFGAGNPGGNGNNFFLLAENGKSPDSDHITIPPGETFVYTVDIKRSKRTGANLIRDYSKTDYMNNLLTPYDNDITPDNYLLVDKVVGGGPRKTALDRFYGVNTDWSSVIRENDQDRPKIQPNQVNVAEPVTFREDPGPGNRGGGDNYQFALFDATGFTRANHGWKHGNPGTHHPQDSSMDEMPMVTMGNISLQAGGSDELPLKWSSGSHPVLLMPKKGAPLKRDGTDANPSERTRDGFRLRWYDEHASNLSNSQQLGPQTEQLFQTAGIGNWNVRSTYNLRNPFDNVTEKPPYFFGNYTRDQLDFEVGWEAMRPNLSQSGFQTGFPFGPPDSEFNKGPVILFELPTEKIAVPNLAYLRNLQLSEYPWHPTYPIGNSLADPRCAPENTAPDLSALPSQSTGGWNSRTMGDDNGRDGKDYWSALNAELIGFTPYDNTVVYDLSYEVNYNLWDTYMLSVGSANSADRAKRIANFAQNPSEKPLPNGRMGIFNRTDLDTDLEEDLNDFFRAAARLSLEGGFDVNSTSIESWKAVLASSKGTILKDSQDAVFPRFLNPLGDTVGNVGITEDSLSGNRELTDGDIEVLAQEIVAQVKKRAPFFGLADFVNRRLTPDIDLARAGTIEAALQESGINSEMDKDILAVTDRGTELKDFGFKKMTDATRLDHRLKPTSQAWGLSGYLTQGDVLGVIGSSLAPRSDTFTIRTYGESRDIGGKVLARAWLEATVQRTPQPVVADEYGINPLPVTGDEVDFGRRFEIVGVRWLSPKEV